VLDPWSAVGDAHLSLQNLTIPLSEALPTSVQVDTTGYSTVGILNPGWWGIDVQLQTYTGSFWVLGTYEGHFVAKLQSSVDSTVFASALVESQAQSGTWVQHNFTLTPSVAAPDSNNTFVIEFQGGQGPLNFNLISLFPPTYNNRPNGLRIDLMEALKALNPSFLRIPGGNNL
jgi:alpha-N-arabinofuranosidase